MPAVPPNAPLREILVRFLYLGLTAFGGPVAHLAHFREELVRRRGWLDEAAYAELVALCQFLPGPASSQVGFALGLHRGGLAGALVAWLAFTLPSALLLLALAWGMTAMDGPFAPGIIHGLKLVAVAVVAQAVWGMARHLCPDRQRAAIALAGVMAVTFLPAGAGSIAAIVFGALAGLWLYRDPDLPAGNGLDFGLSRRFGGLMLAAFAGLLAGLPAVAWLYPEGGLALFTAFYRAGALVFGGGHVVLPLLEGSVVAPGWVDPEAFLAGYGAAQAVPGPLFTVSAYLGALAEPAATPLAGAALALAGIFLPGLLLLMGVLPFWNALRHRPAARALMAGANAAVVGILAAALHDPLWTGTVHSSVDFAIALAALLLLTVWGRPPWQVVLLTVAAALAA